MKAGIEPPALARRLGVGALALYGIGDILGAGIYALVGKVVDLAGQGAWISFLVSAFLAAITGLTYAELSSRIPRSGGAAAYTGSAFRSPWVPFLVGFFVLASGLTSAATVALALNGYLSVFIPLPDWLAALFLIGVISFIAYRGIELSARANNVMTVAEGAGLVAVIVVGASVAVRREPALLMAQLTPDAGLGPLLAGATLAFYAFIGFEDLANLAEEAKDARRSLPRAILIAVSVSTVIYLAVIVTVLWTVGSDATRFTERPLLDVFREAGAPMPIWLFAIIAIVAVANTGLTNFIMVTRLLYGMSRQRLLPASLGAIHAVRRTPWIAIGVAAALVGILSFTGGVRQLAQTTSLLLVTVFGALHVSLLLIRRRDPVAEGIFQAPRAVPWIGLAACAFLFAYFPRAAYLRGGLVLLAGLFCGAVMLLGRRRPDQIESDQYSS